MSNVAHTTTAGNVLATGTEVIATDYRGIEVTGVITERYWWFDGVLDFYVVKTQPADPARPWEYQEHRIYPVCDAIRAAR